MSFLKKITSAAALSTAVLAGAANAETVTMMHVESTGTPQYAMWETFIQEFEAKNPGIDVVSEFVENEAFKAKLPTLLQSDARPNIFYSWGGGNFATRAQEGLLEDITAQSGKFKKMLSKGGISAFTYDGKIYGLPYNLAQVGFWYNKTLFDKAGVNADKIKSWDDLLDAVKKLKAAGITPITVGAGDKWPAHFYWTYLAMRTGGTKTFNAATSGDMSWDNPAYVEAGELLAQLVALKPFQPGFAAMTYGDASGKFGDQEAAMHLMGDWDLAVQKDNSKDKNGIPRENIGFFSFPKVKGGKGDGGDTLGAVNGFAFAKGGATPAAIKWMEYFLDEPQQSRLAAAGIIVPVAKGAGDSIKDPFFKLFAENLSKAKWHQVFWDQALGSDVGGTINDFSAQLMSGDVSPKEAVEMLQEAWEFK